MKYAVYLCGDELPTKVFPTRWEAEHFLEQYSGDSYRWMDRRIEEVHETNTDNPIDFPK